jgi:hypothetical protein
LNGGLSVTPSGGVSYSIPLDVPQGPGGLQPSLSLDYSSGGGNGILGVGWSVGGLSGITRCGMSTASDGKQTGVKFKDTTTASGGDADQFCLDGQKLVAIKGAYGASQTEYRTESESWSKIVSYDSDASGPGWFEVRAKDGRKMQYRPKTAARLTADATGVRTAAASVRFAYPLDTVMDRSGNAIAYSYDVEETDPHAGDAVSASVLLKSITYSGRIHQREATEGRVPVPER